METSYINSRSNHNLYIENKDFGNEGPLFLFPDEVLFHIFSYLNPKIKESWNIVLVSKRFCRVGRDALDPSFDGNTWLLSAMKLRNLEGVSWLISDKRVLLSCVSSANQKMLEVACYTGQLEVVKLLLKDPRVVLDWLPFYRACEHGNLEVVEEMLNDPRIVPCGVSYADREMLNPINDTDSSTDSDEDSDFEDEKIEKMKMQVEYDKKRHLIAALNIASRKGYAEIVKKILSFEIDPNERSSNKSNVLEAACSSGQLEVVKLLLKDPRVDFHYKKDQAFYLACVNGRLEVVEEMLNDQRIDPSRRKDNAPLVVSMENATSAVAMRLLNDQRIDATLINNLPLQLAVKYRKGDVVKRLMEEKHVRVCLATFTGALNLFRLYRKGDEEIISQLLEDKQFDLSEKEVNQILRNTIGWLPIEIAEVLFKDERIYRRMDMDGIFEQAVPAGRFDIVQFLMKGQHCDPSAGGNVLKMKAIQSKLRPWWSSTSC